MWETLLGLGLKYLPTVLGWFGITGTPDPAAAERKAGYDLGKAETVEASARGELQGIKLAHDVENKVATDAAINPDSIKSSDGFRRD